MWGEGERDQREGNGYTRGERRPFCGREDGGKGPRVAQVSVTDAEAPFVLTVDVGTSSARALLYDARAEPIADMVAQIANDMTTTADGGVYCDADLLVERTARVIDMALAAAGT